ncbi:MAG: hypothetical protein HQK81_10925 [Desulfovibrionaceae bacterium]|nr:hypothetical protein [Desulfovibrionaceae bacterium]MBF0514554.1 hypothetical protein [Desulfovibrionaceae bacterium]
MKIIVIFSSMLLLAFHGIAFAGIADFNSDVERIAAAVEVGVRHERFNELLADAQADGRVHCGTMEAGQKSGSYYCLAFWYFKAAALSWGYGNSNELLATGMEKVKIAREKHEKTKK